MRRSILIVSSVVLASMALFAGAFVLSSRICSHHLSCPTDDLSWLRVEFSLSDAELQRIRKLHEGYLPVCEKFCADIEVEQQQLKVLTQQGSNTSDQVAQQLQEIADLRAQCQAAMLKHFEAVSQEMPRPQSERYMAEMRRLTLGFHEQIEESMAGSRGNGHGHH